MRLAIQTVAAIAVIFVVATVHAFVVTYEANHEDRW